MFLYQLSTLFNKLRPLFTTHTHTRADKEQFEDTKGVIRIRISKKNRQEKVQKDKRSTKHTHKTNDR